MLGRLLLAAAAIGLACATAPGTPEPGKSTAWGLVRLIPREGVSPQAPGSSSYTDRRLRDVEFVDYSRPGFAVVYLEEAGKRAVAVGGDARVSIRDTQLQPRFDPAHAAMGIGRRIRVANQSTQPHVLSCPAVGLLRRLAPGETAEIVIRAAGEVSLFLLDVPGASSTIFAAPGRYAVVSQSGRFEFQNLTPGHFRLRTWHPRFPPTSRQVDLAAGQVVHLDLEIGVGRGTTR